MLSDIRNSITWNSAKVFINYALAPRRMKTKQYWELITGIMLLEFDDGTYKIQFSAHDKAQIIHT